jgi:hypothetical protein
MNEIHKGHVQDEITTLIKGRCSGTLWGLQ